MFLSDLKDKKILILGFGREGQDSYLFLKKHFPEKSLGVADQKEFEEFPSDVQRMLNKDNKVVLYFGPEYLKQVNKYDVAIKSPGIPFQTLKPFLKNQLLTSQTNIFFANCPGKIIGITGTKGKSTTASLIHHVLKSSGIKAHLVGNIEEPVLKFLDHAGKDDIFVYELSSFQLEHAVQSPHIAILLNLYPEHLDHHGTFQNYAKAKANITKFQTSQDYLIFNETDEQVKRIALHSNAAKIPYTPKREQGALYVAALEPVFLVSQLFDIPQEKVQRALKKFKPLPHRLQNMGTHRGITFYNDSLATVPQATIAALDMLGDKVATLIVGGHDRGVPYSALAARILESGVQNLILFPNTGELVFKELQNLQLKQKNAQLPTIFRAQNMDEAVRLCYQHTPKGFICLLSPAASSFSMFRDYKERAEQFKTFVARYAQKTLA